MKIRFRYEPSIYYPMWTVDLPTLSQKVYRWWQSETYNNDTLVDMYVYDGYVPLPDDDFPAPHLDHPFLNDHFKEVYELARQSKPF